MQCMEDKCSFFLNTTILETTRYMDRPSIRRLLRFIRHSETCTLIKDNRIKFQQFLHDATMQCEACRNQMSLREVTTIGSSSTQTRAQYTHAHTRTHAHTYTHIHTHTHYTYVHAHICVMESCYKLYRHHSYTDVVTIIIVHVTCFIPILLQLYNTYIYIYIILYVHNISLHTVVYAKWYIIYKIK